MPRKISQQTLDNLLLSMLICHMLISNPLNLINPNSVSLGIRKVHFFLGRLCLTLTYNHKGHYCNGTKNANCYLIK
jgi:hypothetical protein